MRWTIKQEPKWGDTRTKIKFAWLPVKIENTVVWLEEYESLQRYGRYAGFLYGYVRKWLETERKIFDGRE